MKTSAKVTYNGMRSRLLLLAVFALLNFGYNQPSSAASVYKTSVADTSTSANIRQILNGNKIGITVCFPESVKRFYMQRAFAPNWVNPQANTKPTWESMLMLDCVLQFGLAHEDYHPGDLLYTKLHDILERPSTVSSVEKAKYDILLTDAMITFINHLHFGKLNPEYPASKIDRLQSGFNAGAALASAMQQKDYMAAILDVQPKSKEYSDLQSRMHLLEGIYQDDCYEVPEAEVRKIAINMERLRWINVEGDSYIQINIPSFTLKFHQPDTTYEFNILAGKPSTPTPILKSAITYFSTASNRKPGRSATTRKLPVNKEKEYQGNNAANNYVPQTNAKGVIYFWLADSHGISLQGTAKAQLAKSKERAVTDGSIRIENGKKFAALLLEKDNAAIRTKEMFTAVAAAQLKNFMLHTPVPVKITYVTCEMKEGIIITYPDIYNQDKKLEMALYNTTQTLTMQ